MTTKAWLEGHQFDLADLAELLASGDVRVEHDDDENAYYLTAPEIDNPAETNRFDVPAERLLVRINGLGRTRRGDFRPVKLSGRYTNPSGTHIHVAAANLEARARLTATAVVIGPNGQPLPDPPSPWPDRLALAASRPEVAEVLQVMGQAQPLGWVDLYKVFEIIRDSIRQDTIVGLGWATETHRSAFTASANRPDVSGTEARHARMSGGPPTHQMSLAEGRSFVSNLVTEWLKSLAGR